MGKKECEIRITREKRFEIKRIKEKIKSQNLIISYLESNEEK
jgi:hypothetical protein